MTSQDAIRKINELVKPIDRLLKMPYGNVEFPRWYQRVVMTLRHVYSSQIKSFANIRFTLGRYYIVEEEWKVQRAYESGLRNAKSFLEVLVEEITEYGLGEGDNTIGVGCMHPIVEDVSKKAMKAGLYADAVERAFKAISSRVKKMVKGRVQPNTDGVRLMQKVFSPEAPLIRLADSADSSAQDVQRGYMYMFAGGMSAIRNPKAHDNIEIDKNDTMRKLYFVSMLMYKLDEAEGRGWV